MYYFWQGFLLLGCRIEIRVESFKSHYLRPKLDDKGMEQKRASQKEQKRASQKY